MLKLFLLAFSLALESVITFVLTGIIFILSFFVISQGFILSIEKTIKQYAGLDYHYWLVGFALVLISYLFGNILTKKVATSS